MVCVALAEANLLSHSAERTTDFRGTPGLACPSARWKQPDVHARVDETIISVHTLEDAGNSAGEGDSRIVTRQAAGGGSHPRLP